ncbi:MAG TPA: hypothetical protein VK968_05455, partial [Roseimicrobium sp.]|nr:hypothetical protein [Roseimicrobium sp.]
MANGTNNTLSKVTPAGWVSSFATGFNQPTGLAIDPAGYLYVTNFGNGQISKVTPIGTVSTLASFSQPYGVAFDAQGNLYVASYGGNLVIKLAPSVTVRYATSGTAQSLKEYDGITPSSGQIVFAPGTTTATITGRLLPNPGTSKTLIVTLNTPAGISLGTVRTHTLTIVEPPPTVTPSTAGLPINAMTLTIGGRFNLTAATNIVTFNNGAVGTVTSGTATSLNISLTTLPNRVGPLLATVTADGLSSGPMQVATVVPAVTSGSSSIGLNAATLTINGFGFDPIAANNTVTFNNGAIGTVTAASATQLTVTITTPPAKTGNLTATVTTNGNTSIANVPVATALPLVQFDTNGESVHASTGTFSIPVRLVGSPTFDSGTPPVTRPYATGFNYPMGMVFDGAGNLYVANNLGDSISKVAPDGTVSTFASGFPYSFYSTSYPCGLAFDPVGNLYVAVMGNSSVNKVTPAGTASTFISADTVAGVAFDAAGNLYATDLDFGSWIVSKTTPAGTKTTFVYTGDRAAALVFDAAGNLYIGSSDYLTKVTKVSPDGTPLGSFDLGNNGSITPGGLAVDSAGNVYATSFNRISKITPLGVVTDFLKNLISPGGLAFDVAGDLY